MIVVRNVFQLKFGTAKEAKALIKEGVEIVKKVGVNNNRACLDVTGPFYTLAFENTFENLGAFEDAQAKLRKDAAWQKWYASFSELLESGHREIYTVVD
jgi:hypothetical protein